MNRLMIGLWLGLFMAAVPVQAEKPETTGTDLHPSVSPGELTPTPEMWFYDEDFRRYLDPKLAVRRKAEFRAATRMQRQAALKWFGLSNSRPQASPSLMSMTYSPGWVGNTYDPFAWRGTSATTTVLYSDSPQR